MYSNFNLDSPNLQSFERDFAPRHLLEGFNWIMSVKPWAELDDLAYIFA